MQHSKDLKLSVTAPQNKRNSTLNGDSGKSLVKTSELSCFEGREVATNLVLGSAGTDGSVQTRHRGVVLVQAKSSTKSLIGKPKTSAVLVKKTLHKILCCFYD